MGHDPAVKSRINNYVLLGILAILLVGLRLCFLHVPFERDEGFYSTIGQVILRGGIPYRDAIDMKPPGIFYIYASAIALFGKTVESIRLFTAIYSVFSLCAVFWITRYVAGSAAGLIAAGFFAVFSGAPLLQASGSNIEVFLMLPLLLSVLFLIRSSHSQRRSDLVISGFFAGVTLLVKTVALPYVMLLFICIFFISTPRNSVGEKVANAVAFVAPMVVAAAVTVLYFFLNGALDEFIQLNIVLPLSYSKGGTVAAFSPFKVTGILMPELLPLLILSVPAAVWLMTGARGFTGRLIGFLLPASILGVCLPGKYFPHYFIQLIPFLSILSGVGLSVLFAVRRKIFYAVLPILAAAILFFAYREYELYFVFTPKQVSVAKYGKIFVNSVYVADYLKKRTTPEDYIFQWGFEPELYFLADRRCPVPYISSTIPEAMPDPGEAVRSMVERLNATKPRYVILQREWAEALGLDEIQTMLARDYHPETVIGYAFIYRRNE